MKRKMLAGLLAVSLCVGVAGCASQSSDSGQNVQSGQEAQESTAVAADHMILDGIKGEAGVVDKTPEELKKDAREQGISYAYEENCEAGGDESGENTSLYLQRYELYLRDDGKAKLLDISDYGNGHVMISEYLGTAEKSDALVTFYFQDSPEENGKNLYTFDLDGEKVTKVSYKYLQTDFEGIEGTYKAETEEFGMTTIEINQFGEAELTKEDGTKLKGNVSLYDDRYDMMVSDEDYSETVDWFVDFNGDSFTYEDYQKSIYKDYAGTYKCFGSLGDLELTVDERGIASTTVTIDGEKHEMNGTIGIDPDTNKFNGAYLSTEDGYGLDLTLVDWEDGTYNYSGTLSSPLNAG